MRLPRNICYMFAITASLLAVPNGAIAAGAAATSTVAKCDDIYAVDPRETYRVDEAAVHQCIWRGWDPPSAPISAVPGLGAPLGWKRNGGKSAGVRVSGSGGIVYGSIQAPKDSPHALKARASVSGAVITATCNFPPRIKISFSGGSPSVNFPAGSCYDFLNGLFKDKADAPAPATPLPGGVDDTACPEESDNTGAFGVKQPLASGTAGYSCGGMVPLTTTDIVLNAHPDSLVTVEEGSPYLWSYHKNGTSFSNVLNGVRLPTYLCTLQNIGESSIWVKTVDLTPPTAQMITYNGNTGEINIRLQPRETMNPNFIPPYDQDAPEKYLVIPVDGSGTPQIPPDCADEATYWREPTGKQDILIRASSNAGCEGVGVGGTASNNYYYSCDTVGGTLSGTICVDGDGQKIGNAVAVDNWVTSCPSGNPPVGGVCQEANGVPPEASCGAAAAAATVTASCDSINIAPKGDSCADQLQFAVLDRPNMYYPSAVGSTIYPITGRTAMMTTTDNATLYTQASTIFYLQNTAPPITFNEGGYINLETGDTLIMNPPAIISGHSVSLPKGGQLVSSGGTQKATYPDNSTTSIPGSSIVTVKVGRSVQMPAGYLYPTAPKVGTETPYVRLPVPTPPKE